MKIWRLIGDLINIHNIHYTLMESKKIFQQWILKSCSGDLMFLLCGPTIHKLELYLVVCYIWIWEHFFSFEVKLYFGLLHMSVNNSSVYWLVCPFFLPLMILCLEIGSDSESSRLSEPGASQHGSGLGNPVERIGGTETDDDDSEASGSDGEQELRVNGQPTRGACASTRSY